MVLKKINKCLFESKFLFNNGNYEEAVAKINAVLSEVDCGCKNFSDKENETIFNLYRQLYEALLFLKDKSGQNNVLSKISKWAKITNKEDWVDFEVLEAQVRSVALDDDIETAKFLTKKYKNLMDAAFNKENKLLALWTGNKYLKLMYFARDFDGFQKVGDNLLRLADDLEQKEAALWIYHHLGMLYLGIDDIENAKKSFSSSLDLSYELNQKDGIVWNTYNLGMLAAEKGGNKDEISGYFFQAIAASNEADNFDEEHKKMLKSYLPQLNEHLLHFNKLAMSSKVLMSEVHELKNFLTGSSLEISNLMFLLGQAENISPEIKDFVDSISSTNKQVVSKVKDILHFVRRGELTTGSMETSLNIFIKKFRQKTTTLVKDNQVELIIINELKDQNADLRVSDKSLYQALLNLLLNAIDAMNGMDNKKIKISIAGTIDSYAILFGNNGPAIDQSTAKSIFEPFFTTKEEGTGLGLFIVKKLLVDEGASLDLVSVDPVEFKISGL